MEVQLIDGAPDDAQVAAIIALAVQSYLASEMQDPKDPIQAMSPWRAAGRLEAHSVSGSPGQVRGQWRRGVS
jgi:hypothetical protein